MCTYNGEDFLQEQIDSILNQSNVEVMLNIRDDGSTDRTLSILESYEEKINWYITHFRIRMMFGFLINWIGLYRF